MDDKAFFKIIKKLYHAGDGTLAESPQLSMDGGPVADVAATLLRFSPFLRSWGHALYIEKTDGSIGIVTTISPNGIRAEQVFGENRGEWDWFHSTEELVAHGQDSK